MSEPPAARKYDLYSQATKNDPFPVFAAMQRDNPVFCQPGLDGKTMIWFLTRFDDVQAMLQDASTFVRDPRNALPAGGVPEMDGLEALLGNHMLNKDGAEHQRLRTLIAQAFTPARVKALRPRVQQIADELIARVQSDGRMDFVADYAYQLPTIVIAELLGIPSADREHFKAWSSAFISPALTEEQQARAGQLLTEFVAYLRGLFDKRRATPRDDLITALLQAEESGERLSEGELFSTMVLLIVAGHETTVNLIGNALLSLLRHSETLANLKAHPERMPAAIEEFLRFESPVERALARWAARDTTVHGHQIRRGDVVMGILGAANRDPERFEHPDALEVNRPPQRHLAFGHGLHYCIGAPLARLEGEIALNTVLQRLPNIRLEGNMEDLIWQTTPMFRGLMALPVVWDTPS
jgi:cytochrome P450